MPPKPVAVVFVHGLARKPAPEKLRDLWLEGLGARQPAPDVFAAPNEGLALSTKGVPTSFSYYADVFYGTTTRRTSRRTTRRTRAADTIAAERLDVVEADLTRRARDAARARVRPQAGGEAPGEPRRAAWPGDGGAGRSAGADLEIASWLPGPVKQAIIKKAAMEAFYFLFDKEYERRRRRALQGALGAAPAPAGGAGRRGREGGQGRAGRAQHGHDGRVRRAKELPRVPAR
jgi:hypothetical protein